MDFIRQLNGFRRKRLSKPISANGIALYISLFECCNDMRFPERFTIPNSVLQMYSGLSVKALQRARNELMQKGYIQYKSGSGNQCGSYEMIDLCGEADNGSRDKTDAENYTEGQFDPSFCPANVQQTVPQMSNNVSTLNKPTGDKDFFINNNNITREDVLNHYEKVMGERAHPLVEQEIDTWLMWVEGSLVCYAISESVYANACNWRYIEGILRKCRAKGWKTWEEAEDEATCWRYEKSDEYILDSIDF